MVASSDGAGMRKSASLVDVLMTLVAGTRQHSIDFLFINGRTPALIQAGLFCSYHLFVSPHSSQLTNLVFARPGVSVIELQNEMFVENTFIDLGTKVGIDYHLPKQGE